MLSRVSRPWQTATPGPAPTTIVHPGVAEPSTNPLRSPLLVPNLAAVKELFVDVLAAGPVYLLELLKVGLIRQILPAR